MDNYTSMYSIYICYKPCFPQILIEFPIYSNRWKSNLEKRFSSPLSFPQKFSNINFHLFCFQFLERWHGVILPIHTILLIFFTNCNMSAKNTSFLSNCRTLKRCNFFFSAHPSRKSNVLIVSKFESVWIYFWTWGKLNGLRVYRFRQSNWVARIWVIERSTW